MGRRDLTPEITGKARAGDIRHCFADISLAQRVLGFAPQRRISSTAWRNWRNGSRGRRRTDRVHEARRELEARGLVA